MSPMWHWLWDLIFYQPPKGHSLQERYPAAPGAFVTSYSSIELTDDAFVEQPRIWHQPMTTPPIGRSDDELRIMYREWKTSELLGFIASIERDLKTAQDRQTISFCQRRLKLLNEVLNERRDPL